LSDKEAEAIEEERAEKEEGEEKMKNNNNEVKIEKQEGEEKKKPAKKGKEKEESDEEGEEDAIAKGFKNLDTIQKFTQIFSNIKHQTAPSGESIKSVLESEDPINGMIKIYAMKAFQQMMQQDTDDNQDETKEAFQEITQSFSQKLEDISSTIVNSFKSQIEELQKEINELQKPPPSEEEALVNFVEKKKKEDELLAKLSELVKVSKPAEKDELDDDKMAEYLKAHGWEVKPKNETFQEQMKNLQDTVNELRSKLEEQEKRIQEERKEMYLKGIEEGKKKAIEESQRTADMLDMGLSVLDSILDKFSGAEAYSAGQALSKALQRIRTSATGAANAGVGASTGTAANQNPAPSEQQQEGEAEGGGE